MIDKSSRAGRPASPRSAIQHQQLTQIKIVPGSVTAWLAGVSLYCTPVLLYWLDTRARALRPVPPGCVVWRPVRPLRSVSVSRVSERLSSVSRAASPASLRDSVTTQELQHTQVTR